MNTIFVFIEWKLECQTCCLKYSIKTKQWTYIANMNKYRYNAACTLLEGKIVVSGGIILRTVEAYDYY